MILYWQKVQISNFADFIEENAKHTWNRKILEFQQFVYNYLNSSNDDSNLFLQHQIASLERYKELLLFSYIARNRTEQVQFLLNEQASPESRLLNNATPLYVAAQLGGVNIVKLLIEHKANTEAFRDNKATALITASYQGFTEIVELLLRS